MKLRLIDTPKIKNQSPGEMGEEQVLRLTVFMFGFSYCISYDIDS